MTLSYILKVTIIWGFSYGFYYWWLRGEKLPRANRFFLLIWLVAGPVLSYFPSPTFWSGGESAVTPALAPVQTFFIRLQTVTVSGTVDETSWWSSISWLELLWWAGGLLLLSRMLYGWSQIYRLWRVGEKRREDGIISVRLKDLASPFSYGPWLFWDQGMDRTSPTYHSVWLHEKAHVQQGHSLDLLLADLLLLFFWWHPLPHAFRRSLRMQHEYLADTAATRAEGISLRSYANTLLQQNLVGWVPKPAHAFHTSNLKKRIIMLTQPKGASWKLVAIIPLMLAIFWACEKESDLVDANISELEEKLADKPPVVPGNFEIVRDTIITFNPETLEESVQVVESKLYLTVDQMPVYGNCDAEAASGNDEELTNCSNLNLLQTVYGNIKYPEAARDAGLEGMVVLSFVVPADNSGLHSLKILKAAKPDGAIPTAAEAKGYEAMSEAVLEMARTIPNDWQAGIHEGEPVSVRFNLPIKFRLE